MTCVMRDSRLQNATLVALAALAAGSVHVAESTPFCPQTEYLPQRDKTVPGTSGHGFQQSWRPGKKKKKGRRRA